MSAPPQDGTVRNAGMFVRTAGDQDPNYVMLGSEVEHDYWLTGITTSGNMPDAFTHDGE